MFTDPQTVTISTVANNLPRIPAGNENGGRFRSADGSLELVVSHTATRRERSVVRLNRNKVGADPLDSTKQKAYSVSYYLVVDAPLNGVGFTDAEQEADIKGLLALVNSSGWALKFLGKEA